MTKLVEVASVDDLPEGRTVVVKAAGRELVLVRRGGEIYALRNVCPHMTCAFAGGAVIKFRSGAVGEVTCDASAPIIACPWHQYEYSLIDGQCLTDERLRVRRYRVTVDGERVLVDLQSRSPRQQTAA